MKITGISSDGRGITHIDGKTVFVKGGITGDDVNIKILSDKKSFFEAEVTEIISESPDRIIPECPYFHLCGGCSNAHMSYELELKAKAENAEQAMQRIGGFKDFKFDSVESGSSTRYRNKAVYKLNGINCGFFAPKSHNVINIDDCLLCNEADKDIIGAVKKYISEENDNIKELFIRHGRSAMVSLSCERNLKNEKKLIEYVAAADKMISSVILNVGKKSRVIFGKEYIESEIAGVSFRISEQSFFQVNPHMTEVLYKKALEYADITADNDVLDIYCGIGTISLCAAKNAKRVIGVEIVSQAIENAKYNAAANNISNAEFYASSAEKAVPELLRNKIRPDIVILDPPRKGSDAKTLNAILSAAPKRIVYVSCNPSTLARDARALADGGYNITKACAVDMFPRTSHVECVALIKRKEIIK